MKFIDEFLNTITMYRLVLYYLTGVFIVAFILSFFHFFPFSPISIFISTSYFIALCWILNSIFSKIFSAPTNIESVYITAFILALVVSPFQNFHEILFATITGVITISSKFILTFNKKHIFNPAAVGILLAGILGGGNASWWIGTSSMAIFVLLGGLVVVRKLQKELMVITFFIFACAAIIVSALTQGLFTLYSFKNIILETPILFFAFVMFTEPLTTPPVKKLQLIYAGITGLLFAPQTHILNIYSSPELALCVGNIFSFLVSPKERLVLFLKERTVISPTIIDFIFPTEKKLAFSPGQYMEWTLSHKLPDSRGNRRYFTIASSPTENTLRLGVRFYDKPSTFKNSLFNLKSTQPVVASQIAGDFTMPKDKEKKLIFIASGIGITPFRSMIKYLIDSNEKRDIVLIYINKNEEDIAYKDVFDEGKVIGLKTFYVTGFIDEDFIKYNVLDFKDRLFYISGSQARLVKIEEILKLVGVPKSHIKKDFFPGLV